MTTYNLEAHAEEEYLDEYPDYFSVNIDRKKAARIMQLHGLLKEIKAASIHDQDYSTDMLDDDHRATEYRTDVHQMIVTDFGVSWDCYLKHTNYRIYSDHISINTIAEITGASL